MTLYPPRCPKCGSGHLEIELCGNSDEPGVFVHYKTATCMVCGWTGWASEADA